MKLAHALFGLGCLTFALPAVAQQAERTPTIATPPLWSTGLDGYVGIGVIQQDETGSQALAGVRGRLRYRGVELGGLWEVVDVPQGELRRFGGSLGAIIPFHYWVDVEPAVLLSRSAYLDDDARYGDGGLHVKLPTLGLRLGVSHRQGDRVGTRLGTFLAFNYDLAERHVPWKMTSAVDGRPLFEEGATRVGGWSLLMAVAVGLDVERD
jgi:hypothetical protein